MTHANLATFSRLPGGLRQAERRQPCRRDYSLSVALQVGCPLPTRETLSHSEGEECLRTHSFCALNSPVRLPPDGGRPPRGADGNTPLPPSSEITPPRGPAVRGVLWVTSN